MGQDIFKIGEGKDGRLRISNLFKTETDEDVN